MWVDTQEAGLAKLSSQMIVRLLLPWEVLVMYRQDMQHVSRPGNRYLLAVVGRISKGCARVPVRVQGFRLRGEGTVSSTA